MTGFSKIATKRELAEYLDIPYKKLTYILYKVNTENLYYSFEIPKKSGENRSIHAPMDDLKEIQQKLAAALYNHQENVWKERDIKPNLSHGFEKEKTIVTNAKIHRNKRIVINIDLENFFDSFHFGRVCGFFEKNKNLLLPKDVATVIAQLCCYKGCLPQGAPTSPVITNLICQIFDMRVLKIAKKHHLDYTRYADDLTFSTNDKSFMERWEKFYKTLSKEIEDAGFQINSKKTTVRFKDSQQVVTGLTVNQKINVDHRYYKKVRAMANSLYRNGNFAIDGEKGTLKQLEGKFAFIDQIDKYNNKKDLSCQHDVYRLNSRERQYQQFIFYKYFFANEKPVIITEGKTDIKYLKAALKNLYENYPNLIEKKKDGKFEFKVSFLVRSKRLKYFFGMSQDGGDAMKNLYYFFSNSGGDNIPNYLEKFIKISERQPMNPVILIFDNEMNTKGKPLNTFLKQAVHLSKEKDKELKNNLRVKLNEKGNVFLVTNPLIDDAKESEIEDLFDKKTLSHKIGEKEFDRNAKADSDKFYGKEIFSKYISSNYRDIDFSGFRPLLSNIQNIVSTYSESIDL